MVAVLASPVLADNFTFSGSIPAGQSYLDAIWSPGSVAPAAGNTYEVVGGATMYAPRTAGIVTFPGDSFKLNSGTILRAGTNRITMDLRFPGVGANPGFILAGGSVLLNASNVTFSGTLQVQAPSMISNLANQVRGLTVASTVSGAGDLNLVGVGVLNLPFDFTAVSNSFSGSFVLGRFANLRGSGIGSLGRASILATSQSNRFEPMYDMATPGALRLASNALMVLHQNCVFGAVIVTNYSLPIGTYSYAYLTNTFRAKTNSCGFIGTAGQIVVLPAPTGLAATPGNAQVALAWSAVTSSNTYKVYRGPGADGPFDLLSSGASTSFTDNTAANGTTYFYAVTAVSPTGGESSYRDPVSATPAAPPPGPTGLAAASGDTTVTLTWSAAAGAAEYHIKRSAVSGGGYVSIATNLPGNLAYLDTGLVNGSTYYYVVTALSVGGESAPSNEAVGRPNPAPADLAAVGGLGRVTLSWSSFAGALSYNVKRASASFGPYTTIASGLSASLTGYTNTPLADGQIFYYVISAQLAAGESPISTEVSAITRPATPTGLTAASQNYAEVLLTWANANNPALTTIRIERSGDGVSYSQIDAVPATQTSYVAGNLTLLSTYYFRIRASNLTGDSPYSSVASASTPGLTVGLNFANGNAGVPLNDPAPVYPGYLVDIGQTYGSRTNGSVYGWSVDNTTNGIWRKTATVPDGRYGTLQIMQSPSFSRRWEIALPRGTYQFHLVGGDPGPNAGYPMIEQFNVEGLTTPARTLTTTTRWAEFTDIVQVADGRLSISSGPAAYNNTIDYVDIQALPTPALTLLSASGDNTLFHTFASFSVLVDPATASDPANYVLSNSLGQVFSVGSATVQADGRTVLLSTPLQDNATPYTLVVWNVLDVFGDRAVVAGSRASYVNPVPTPCTLGRLTCEIYYSIAAGGTLASLTNDLNYVTHNPGAISYPTNFGFSFGNNLAYYGTRIYGYFVPPSNGLYRFYLRSDDASAFYMNTNSTRSWEPGGKVLLTQQPACCNPYGPGFMSADIPMNAGQFYYMESLMAQGAGAEYVQVAFKEAGDPSTPVSTGNDYNSGVAASVQSPFLATPLLAIQPLTQPVSQYIEQHRSATFTFSATLVPGPEYFRYQWTKNGTNIPSATGIFTSQSGASVAVLTLPRVDLNDNNALFRCKVSGGDMTYTSDDASLTVYPDSLPPVILSVGSLNGWQIGIRFDGPMEAVNPATAVTNINLYGVDFGLSVTVLKATVLPDGASVLLDLDGNIMDTASWLQSGTVQVDVYNPISDLAGNPIDPGVFYLSAFVSSVIQPAAVSLDVGIQNPTWPDPPYRFYDPQYEGSAFVAWPENIIEIAAGGSDIGVAVSDGFHYVYRPVVPDPVAGLDTAMQIRLSDMTISASSSKAGLMFREGTNSGSRHYSVLATAPLNRGGAGVIQVWSRDIADGNGAMLASVPLPADPPNVWLKLAHAGNTFSALVSTDGANWTVINNHLDPVPYPTLLAGPAVTAFGNSASQPATAAFEGWEFLCTPAIGTQPGPATVITGILQNVTFSGLTLSDVCPVPVTYQWYKGATPLPGQTGSQLTLFSVSVADSGTYYAAVVSSAGVILSDPLSLTVTNALPVVLPETNHITTRVPLNISFAELLANDTDPEDAPLTVLAVNGRGTNVFQSDFNSGLPAGVILASNAVFLPTGGMGDSGVIQLTTNTPPPDAELRGWMVVSNFPSGNLVSSFQVNLDLGLFRGTVPNGGAGFCVAFTPAMPIPTWPGNDQPVGVQSGLSVTFDSHTNTDNSLPAFLVYWDTTVLARVRSISLTNTPDRFIPMEVSLGQDLLRGTVAYLVYDGTNVFPGGVPIPNYVPMAGNFALGARTGSAATGQRIHSVDNLNIQTVSTNYTPLGGQVALGPNYVTYTPPATASGWDSFLYLVSDGQLGGGVWDIKWLQVEPGGTPLPNIQIAQIDATHYRIAWGAGAPQGLYIEYKDVLAAGPWNTDNGAVITQNADGSGAAIVTAGPNARFYRTAY